MAVISESLARREFPNESPLGRRFTADLRSPEKTTFEIVGVVSDANLGDPRIRVHQCAYFPYRQWAFPPQSIVLHARLAAKGSATAASEALRAAVRRVDPALALFGVRTIEQATESLLSSERLATLLATFFAAASALLCALGIYGVVPRELAVRVREAAIRLALGGQFSGVVWRFARRPVLAVLAGLMSGALLLQLMIPAMRPLLSEVQPGNPIWMAGAILLLTLVAAAAVATPAFRARKLEPAALLPGMTNFLGFFRYPVSHSMRTRIQSSQSLQYLSLPSSPGSRSGL